MSLTIGNVFDARVCLQSQFCEEFLQKSDILQKMKKTV